MPSKSRKNRRKSKAKHWLHLRPVHIFFSILVVSTLIVLSAYFVLSRPIKYEGFSKVESANGALKISIPSVMQKNYVGDSVIDFEHRAVGSKDSILAHVRAEAQNVDGGALKKQAPQIRSQFKKGSGNFFAALTRQPLSQPNADNLNFSKFEQYKNSQLNGLIGEFGYQFEDTPVKGRLLIAFGDDEIYIVAVEATSKIWDKNTSVWAEIFESLEVADGR